MIALRVRVASLENHSSPHSLLALAKVAATCTFALTAGATTFARLALAGGLSLLLALDATAQIVPNPVISRNVPAFALNGDSPQQANDASYSTEWRSLGQPSWIAYDLSSVPAAQRQQILVAWHNNGGGYYDVTVLPAESYNLPGPYVIEGNPAPGGGSAPTSGWVVLATGPNPQNYRNNQHYISNFGGNNWLRFRTTAGNPQNNSGNRDVSINLDVHDVHLGVWDSWMFYGDSITYNVMQAGTFATLINAAQPSFFPAASMGGIPFMRAGDVIPLFPRWLPLFPGKYVGISYGTNEAGGITPSQYYLNLKNLADQVLAAGKRPVIPTIMWATSQQRSDQAIRDLNAQIAKLIADYQGQILAGPDLYAAFQNRSNLLFDGLHPNAAGETVMRQAWADKMLSVVYAAAAPQPNLDGVWSQVYNWPLIPVHAALTSEGRVLTYGTKADGTLTGFFIYDVWDPTGPSGGHTTLNNLTGTDIYCSSQIIMPDTGNILISGGDNWNGTATTGIGNNNSNVFSSSGGNTLTRQALNMNRSRWCSSSTVLVNGDIYVQGGTGGADFPEVRQQDGSYRLLGTAGTGGFDANFPRNFLAPDGRIFGYDTSGRMWFISAVGTGSVAAQGQLPTANAGSTSGAAMFRSGKILQIGGNSNGATVIDITGPVPVATPTQSMSTKRMWVSATVLPNGKVLATGGSEVENPLTNVNNRAEIWDPATGFWRLGTAGAKARLYHSGALLLPDATVLVSGGGAPGPETNTNAEIYSPPYLFNSSGALAVRPQITSWPSTAEAGDTLTYQVQGNVARMVLVKTGSTTHSVNMDQRYVELPTTVSGTTVTAQLPVRATDVPPGFYMAFAIDPAGVPSIAKMLRINIDATPNIAVDYTGTMGGGGGSAFTLACPVDEVLVGVHGRFKATGINQVGPQCVKVDQFGHWIGDPVKGPLTGTTTNGTLFEKLCARDSAVSGFRGFADTQVIQIELECRALTPSGGLTGPGTFLGGSGGTGGTAQPLQTCGTGNPGYAFYGLSSSSIDSVGMLCRTGAITPIIVNDLPVIVNPGTQTWAAGSPVSLQITATDANLDPLTYSATSLPAGLSIGVSTGLISGTPAAADSGQATITVNDGKGTSSATFAWSVTGVGPPAGGGLLAAYSFDEGAGTTVVDRSGNTNTGAAQGTVAWTTSGKNNGALVFNGTNTRVQIASSSSLNPTAALTIEAWVYPTVSQSAWRTIVHKEPDAWFMHASNSGTLFPAAGGTYGGTVVYTVSPSAIPVNAWTHLAQTYDGATIRLYVNAALVSSQPKTGAIQTTTSPLSIGGTNVYGEFFQGRIDDVRIYNRALSVSELTSDMNTAVGAPAGDTTPPSAPGTLTATATSATQISLSWGAATDNVGVTGYRVERCSGAGCTTFAQIATPTVTTFNDTGLTASTSYSYRVRAVDAAGNAGAFSNTGSATTQAAPDTTSPSAPGTLTATAASATQINLSWGAATDNVGVTGYRVERCAGAGCTTFAQIATPTVTTFSDTGLTASTSYSYRVRAVDAAANPGAFSNTGTATTQAAPDTTPPSAPGTLTATAASATQINLSWGAATDNVGVTGYQVERCSGVGCTTFAQIATPTGTTFSDTGLTGSTSYSYRVRAVDAAANPGAFSNTGSATTQAAADTTPPSAPGTLTATAASATQINLSWGAATDNVGVTGYQVERCSGVGCTTFAQIATPTGTTFSDTGLTGSTSYSYRVRAVDAAANPGAFSNTGSATTQAAADTTPPSAPGTLTATAASATQISLSWGAATDNIGVTGYQVERCSGVGCTTFAQIATPTGTSFSDTGLTDSMSYSYRVRAVDAAGNPGAFSNTGSASTSDATPPSAPGTLTATAVSATQIDLSWGAATDNVGVTGYRVERCTGAGCTSFAQIAGLTGTTFSDPGLAGTTSYSYRVRAVDAAGNTGPFSNTSSATTPDTTPPSAPGTLTATAVSATQIDLSWGAATDNVGVTGYRVERCSGAGCTSFAQVATPTGTSFNDTGLTASTSYSYRVRAVDAAGNPGAFSNTGSAATQAAADTTPPGAPGTLAATATSATQISLSWGAATDDVGVTGYRVERCSGAGCTSFAQVATPTGTSFNDTGLTASTSYSYRVRAVDAAGNPGAFSNTGSAATQAAADTTPPGAPGTLAATATSATQISLSWGAATDNVGVTGYQVERCTDAGCTTFAQIATPTGTSFSDTGLTASTSYSYRVRAVDAAGNPGAFSNTGSATTPASADTTPPGAPGALAATAASATQIDLSWGAATDDVGVTGYQVERCSGVGCTTFAQIATPTGTSFSDTGLTASTSYSYRVRAVDAAGNPGAFSNTGSAATPAAADTTPPGAPGTLAATATSATQINLSWGAATDDVGVTGYQVERCSGVGCTTFAQIATPTGTSFNDTGLTDSTSYSYRVRAVDAAGNPGPFSNTSSTTTPDATPPSAPGTLTATAASPTQINLSWGAATDNVGVTGYRVERCSGVGCTTFAQIATPTGTSFNDTGLTASTSYSYRVRAVDAAGNPGAFSNTGSATTQATPDTTPPSAPGTLTATAASATQINLAWGAATDNVGVTGYQVERCSGVGCTSFAQIATPTGTSFNDTGLTGSTSYSYRVRAVDAAGNPGAFSNTGSATTPAAADTTPPSAPGTLTATASSATQISLSWVAATDNVGVTGYRVERCTGVGCTTFAQIATPTNTSLNDTGLTAATSYSYRVRAVDAAGNLGTFSNTSSATTPDTTAPSKPGTPTITLVSGKPFLTWTASTDNVGVVGYIIAREAKNGAVDTEIGRSTTTTFTDTSATTGTWYYSIKAYDAAGNVSNRSNTKSIAVP